MTIFLRGPLRISCDGCAAPLPLSRRAQAMLAFLCRQPGMRAERGQLADLLWSDRPEAQARASLRQELARLRKTLPEGLVGANRQAVWLDATRIEVDTSGEGDLLAGFDLASEGFEDWLRGARASAAVPTKRPASDPEGDRPSLAVLPFDELGAPDSDMFADGVVEEITGALSRIHDFHVIARQSALALRGERLTAPEAAKRLGADYLVQGSIRRAGERVRIAVQLVRGANGHMLWSERFDDLVDDLFDLQDRIAARVAGQIFPSLRSAEIERARSRPPTDRTAYDLLLLAYPRFWTLRAEDNAEALRLVSAALERDPDYAPALALKGWILTQQVAYMWSRDPAADRAEAMALAARAAQGAGDHVPTLIAIAAIHAQGGSDPRLAMHLVDRVLAMDPNNAWAWLRKGWLNQYVGKVEEALDCFDRAERLSPLDPFMHQIHFGRAAAIRHWSAEVPRAIEMIEDGLRMYPGVYWPLRLLTVAYAREGRMEAARDAAARLLAHLPHVTIAYLRASLPPIVAKLDPDYFRRLADAGIPER